MFPSRVFLPTFWTETSSEVDDGLAFKLRLVTRDLKAFVWLTSLIWVLIGLAISVFALGYALARNRRSVCRNLNQLHRLEGSGGFVKSASSNDTACIRLKRVEFLRQVLSGSYDNNAFEQRFREEMQHRLEVGPEVDGENHFGIGESTPEIGRNNGLDNLGYDENRF